MERSNQDVQKAVRRCKTMKSWYTGVSRTEYRSPGWLRTNLLSHIACAAMAALQETKAWPCPLSSRHSGFVQRPGLYLARQSRSSSNALSGKRDKKLTGCCPFSSYRLQLDCEASRRAIVTESKLAGMVPGLDSGVHASTSSSVNYFLVLMLGYTL